MPQWTLIFMAYFHEIYTQSDYIMPLEWFQQVATANIPALFAQTWNITLQLQYLCSRN